MNDNEQKLTRDILDSYHAVSGIAKDALQLAQEQNERFALHLFECNSTLEARIALGRGLDRETVAAILHSLAEAIRTQDCAESMSPVSDGNTLSELGL
jgi:hypothetical protein